MPLTFDAFRRIVEKFPVLCHKHVCVSVDVWNDGGFYTIKLRHPSFEIEFDEGKDGPQSFVPFSIHDGQLIYHGNDSVLTELSPFTVFKEIRLT